MQLRGERQSAAFDTVAIEELETGEAGLVEDVPDIFGEIGADGVARNSDAGGPFVGESIDVAEALVAGVLEVGNDLGSGDVGGGDGIGTRGPDGGDPDGSGKVVPLMGEVEVEKLFAAPPLAGFAVFEGEEGRIADEEGCIGVLQHGFEVGSVFHEGGLDLPEAREEDARVGGRSAGRTVQSDATDAVNAIGMADDEDDGAHAILRGDGAAGNHAEQGCQGEGGDGDEADVGGSGSQFRGAFRGSIGGELVALAEARAVRLMLEAPHQGGGIEKVNGRNAETVGEIRGHPPV